MISQMFDPLEKYSYRGFLFRKTLKNKTVYLIRWILTFLTCYLFYSAVALLLGAGLLFIIICIKLLIF